MRLALVLSCVLSVAWTARADEAAEAREHYKKATAHFAVGEFALAADAYQAAYLLKQDAALLFNAAQARRLGGENEKALILYKNYAQLYPKARNIPEVRDQIAKCEEAIAAAAKAKTAPPTNTVEPDKPMPEPTPPPAPAVAATPPLPPPSHERPVPVYKKWWLWTIVGGAVVVAVVVPVAVVASQPPPFSNVDDIANALVRW